MTAAAAGGSFADEAFAATADAYAGAPGWERGLQSAIRRLFEFLAEHPDRASACIAAAADADDGQSALRRRDRTIERFVELLRPGFERAESAPAPVVGEAIGGGIYELVRMHVLERRLDELPAAAPQATIVALAPFIGPAGAAELAASANVQTER